MMNAVNKKLTLQQLFQLLSPLLLPPVPVLLLLLLLLLQAASLTTWTCSPQETACRPHPCRQSAVACSAGWVSCQAWYVAYELHTYSTLTILFSISPGVAS
jgi:hypothetical protein